MLPPSQRSAIPTEIACSPEPVTPASADRVPVVRYVPSATTAMMPAVKWSAE